MAFDNARPDDLFWAARRVMAVTDAQIRAAVKSAEYSDPGAEQYMGDVIIARRDKVGLQWLTGVNPLVDFALDSSGTLSFTNAATATRRATAPESYQLVWGTFDNATGVTTDVGAPETTTTERGSAPGAALAGQFVEVAVRTLHPRYPEWRRPIVAHFRRQTAGWRLVGIRRDGRD